MAFGSPDDDILLPTNGWDWIAPMHTGNYPLFDDFNEIVVAFFQSVPNCDHSLKPGHSHYIGAIFQGILLSLD